MAISGPLWKASCAEDIPGAEWTDLPLRFLRQSGPSPSYERVDLTSGLLMLACGDVIRPDLAWMLTRSHKHLAPVMAEVRDPEGFARLVQLAESGPGSARGEATIAATRIGPPIGSHPMRQRAAAGSRKSRGRSWS